MAGPEGQARLDLDRQVAHLSPPPVMCAVHEEAPGAHRFQPLQRTRHPVDVGHRFPLDDDVGADPGDDPGEPPFDRGVVVEGVERDLVDAGSLVDLDEGERQPVLLEGGVECGIERLRLAPGSLDVEADLAALGGHPSAASRFSLASAVCALSPYAMVPANSPPLESSSTEAVWSIV